MNGIRTVSAADYHADRVIPEQPGLLTQRPSLSAGIASILVNSSPKHAWTAHPRLNPDYVRRDDEKFDVGKVAHAWFLEGDDGLVVVDAADWRTKDAKEQREAARSEGRTALLKHQWDEVWAMCAAVREQLAEWPAHPPLFEEGKPEQTLVWEDQGVLCRARCDWLHDDYSAIDDLKSTSASADGERWKRTMFSIGADVQAAMYARGVEAITGRRPEFRFVVVETYPPYALSVVTLAADAVALANEKVENALAIWRRCLETGKWPAYPTEVYRVEAPPWEIARWDAREVAA